MQKLTEIDSSFLQQETARTPMHISPVLVYDQSARRDHPVKYGEILTAFERNLHKSSIFRRKLAGGAFGLDTPSIDYGQSTDFESHQILGAANVPGLENIANLDQLPAKGSWVVGLPMLIRHGSGAPLRIVALVPE